MEGRPRHVLPDVDFSGEGPAGLSCICRAGGRVDDAVAIADSLAFAIVGRGQHVLVIIEEKDLVCPFCPDGGGSLLQFEIVGHVRIGVRRVEHDGGGMTDADHVDATFDEVVQRGGDLLPIGIEQCVAFAEAESLDVGLAFLPAQLCLYKRFKPVQRVEYIITPYKKGIVRVFLLILVG